MNIDRNLRSTPARILLALPVAAAALSLAACSGAAERPSSAELTAGLTQIFEESGAGGQFTQEQYTCIADSLLDSDLSDQDLANLANGKDVQADQEGYELVATEVSEAAVDCFTE